MWNNMGRKIQALAKVMCWFGIAAAIAGAIVLFQNYYTVAIGVFTIILGPILSWVGSWVLYGFGIIVEKAENTSTVNVKESSSDNSNVNSYLVGNWTCPNCKTDNPRSRATCQNCSYVRP